MRFAALGLPEGPDWALPLIERMLQAVPASSAEPAQGDREGDRAETPPPTHAHADLEALLAYSLVSLVAPQETSATGMMRVRLHPLVRELAREEWMHLPGPEQEAALGGLLAGVRAWLVRYRSVSVSDLETLASDEELIAGTVREAVARHVELPRVVAIVTAWGDYLYARNQPLDREMAELQLEGARWIGDRRAEVEALCSLAREVGLAGQQNEATAYRQAALAIAREMGDQLAVLSLLSRLGATAVRAEAERMYEEANTIACELGDQLTDWSALANLGTFAREMGRLEEAEQWYLRALESTRASGNTFNVGSVETYLGFLYEQMGHTAAAQRLYEGLLPLCRVGGHRLGLGMLLNALVQLALRAGHLETAARDLAEALPLLEQSAAVAMVVQVHGNLAILAGLEAQRRGDQEAAARAFEDALRLFDQNGPEQGGGIATDQRPFVRHLLAELQEQPTAGATALPSKPSTARPPFPRR
jgi:tetratricopeptide (TPR) repeat protein